MVRRLPYPPLVAAFVLALAPVAASLQAEQPAPEALLMANPNADRPAYAELAAAMDATFDSDRLAAAQSEKAMQQLAANPALAEAETISPGLLKELAEDLRILAKQQSERVKALYHPQMLAVYASHLTPEEAASLAEFYRSDIARRLMNRTIDHIGGADDILFARSGGQPVTQEQVRADIGKVARDVAAGLDGDDLAEMTRQVGARPALAKLRVMKPQLEAIRTAMQNEPRNDEENAAMVAAVEAVFDRRFPVQ